MVSVGAALLGDFIDKKVSIIGVLMVSYILCKGADDGG